MILSEFERRLKACNPKLHIKRYGASKAGIHNGTRFICRVPQGEITPYNVFRNEVGNNAQFMSDLNPKGLYKYPLLLKRGRIEAVRILYTQHLIGQSDVSKLSK